MKNRFIVLMLILSLISQSFLGVNPILAEEETENIQWQSIYQAEALQGFLAQIEGRFEEQDQISALLEVNEEYINQGWGLESVDKQELSTSSGIEKQQQYNYESQEILRREMDKLGLNYQETDSFEVVFNGLVVEATVESLKQIAMLKAIKSVTYNETFTAPSKEEVRRFRRSMIQLDEIQTDLSEKYRGKNQLIAIIDTGADITHEIFANHNSGDNKIADASALAQLKSKVGINYGAWVRDKIPFAYNYVDRNTNVMDNSRQPHGMHVAGIAAGNAPNFKGVAPDAQVAVMKVFGAAGTTRVSTYTRALEDAVKLGADSINMSLGTPGGAARDVHRPTITALNNARQAGIVVAVAAGNSGFNGWEDDNRNRPNADNPDYGLLGIPAVVPDALAVASVNNSEVYGRYLQAKDSDKKILYMPSHWLEIPDTEYEYIDGGYGSKEELAAVASEAAAKYVLVQRGDKEGGRTDFTYAEKAENVQEIGARGIIVYNNQKKAPLNNMDVGSVNIPAFFISREDGEFLRNLLSNNAKPSVQFSSTQGLASNPIGYLPSDFSSWGVTPEGNLKPDISAPGGRIYSAFNRNTYGVLDGTSMAAPHVAGGIVIVKEYVENVFPHITGNEKHQLIKNLLMSTAKPYGDEENTYYSPRKQGAGLMQLKNAVNATVVAEGESGVSSINLNRISGKEVTIQGTLHNYGNAPQTFTYHAVVHTDSVSGDEITLKPRRIAESIEQEITVDAGERKDFSVTVSLPENVIRQLENEMPNGFFLDGFVFFVGKNNGIDEAHPNISIPFAGFRGDWGAIPVIESSIYDMLKIGKKPFYFNKSLLTPAFTHLGTAVRGRKLENSPNYKMHEVVLGNLPNSTFTNPLFDKEKIAFSPNGDKDADYIQFYGTFLRDFSNLIIRVYKMEENGQKGKRVYQSSTRGSEGIRNLYKGLDTIYTHTNTGWRWDGRDDRSQKVEDGNYQLEVSVMSLPDKASPQRMTFPVKVDTVAPFVKRASYHQDSHEFSLDEVIEDGSGISHAYVVYDPSRNESSHGNKTDVAVGETVTLKAGFDEEQAKLILLDYAYNKSEIPFRQAIETSGKHHRLDVLVEADFGDPGEVKWEVYSKETGEQITNFTNMKAGAYTLRVTKYNKSYQLLTGESMDFTIGENELIKTIVISLKFIQKVGIRLLLNHSFPSTAEIYWKNVQTGERFLARPEQVIQKEAYTVFLEEGEYLLETEGLTDQILVLADGSTRIAIGENDRGIKEYEAILKAKEVPQPPIKENPAPNPPNDNAPEPKPPVDNTPGPNPPSDSQPEPKPPVGNNPGQNPPSGNQPGQNPPSDSQPGPKPPVGNNPGQNPPSGNQPGPKPPTGNNPGPKPPTGNTPAPKPPIGNSPAPKSPNGNQEVPKPKPVPPIGKPEIRKENKVIEQKSYMQGAADGYFYPDKKLTRAEIAVMLNHFVKNATATTQKVNDIQADQWYAAAVENLLANGIVSGYPDGSYRPSNPLSRAELMVLIARIKGYQPVATGKSFSDLDDALWAKEIILYAAQQGWLKGYPDGTVRPNQEVSRAEAVVIINRAFGFKSSKQQNLFAFPDVEKDHWAYQEIMIATQR